MERAKIWNSNVFPPAASGASTRRQVSPPCPIPKADVVDNLSSAIRGATVDVIADVSLPRKRIAGWGSRFKSTKYSCQHTRLAALVSTHMQLFAVISTRVFICNAQDHSFVVQIKIGTRHLINSIVIPFGGGFNEVS